MGKWTQGPWLYRQNPRDDWGVVRNIEGFVVAMAKNPFVSMQEYADHRAAKTDPYEANARLIAAAPELAEALKEARPCVEEIADQVDCTAPHKAAPIYALLERIDAALAKAGVR